MPLEMTHTHAAPLDTAYRMPLYNLRWSAVFAGLVVGIATNLFLMLAGAAAGLAVFDVGDNLTDPAVPMAAAVWNAVSMIIAAFAGGYVAARSAGMRRASDGILHGVVAWGVTMLLSAFLVSSLTGATLASLVGGSDAAARVAANPGASAAVAKSINQGDREEAIAILRDRLGISSDQAGKLVDQALAVSGNDQAASPEGREAAQKTLHTASMASGWLSAAILLSLLAAMGGGLIGARGTRREVRRSTVGTAAAL